MRGLAPIPYAAWTFHEECMSGELILEQRHGESCGIDVPLEPSDWGELVQAHLVR